MTRRYGRACPTISVPFKAGEHGQVAIKVIDDRGNELLVVKDLKEAE
jgi:adenine-specific DNA-methyltransferase